LFVQRRIPPLPIPEHRKDERKRKVLYHFSAGLDPLFDLLGLSALPPEICPGIQKTGLPLLKTLLGYYFEIISILQTFVEL
jgi:hypothetical protein